MRTVDLGLVEYNQALKFQLDTLEDVKQGADETLIVCSHPRVLTRGRATEDTDIEEWNGEIVDVQRGGRVTFHSPGQIIVYPIVNLKSRGNDLHRFLRNLEDGVIELLKTFDIHSVREEGATGVWVSDKKIASIGIAAKNWISYHGVSFNYQNEFSESGKFLACGFSQSNMIGLDELMVDDLPPRELVTFRLIKIYKEIFKKVRPTFEIRRPDDHLSPE